MSRRVHVVAAASVLALCVGFRCPGAEPRLIPTGAGAGSSAGGGAGGFEPPPGCEAPPLEVDLDGDGYTPASGDCDECDPEVNPGAIELRKPNDSDPVDDDCDGEVDEGPVICGVDGPPGNVLDPFAAAASIELCALGVTPEGEPVGLEGASWVRADGTPLLGPDVSAAQASSFGVSATPAAGPTLLVLSSGHAYAAGDDLGCGLVSCETLGPGNAPPGYPLGAPGCALDTRIADDIGLEVSLRVPSNVHGYQFDVAFFTYDYPEWVCHPYNDQFVALVEPPPEGAVAGNVTFDDAGTPLSALFESLDHCDSTFVNRFAEMCPTDTNLCPEEAPDPFCEAGPGFLEDTGFDVWGDAAEAGAASTGWLRTTVPVEPGSTIRVRFAIFDTGDFQWDSTVILDRFRWLPDGPSRPRTEPL